MTLPRTLAAALATLTLAACAGPGGYQINAHVRAMKAGSRDASGIVAASGAKVDLTCPDAARSRELGATDSEGALAAAGEGLVPLACTVSVAQPGFRPVQYKVSEVCETQNSQGCRAVVVRAILTAPK